MNYHTFRKSLLATTTLVVAASTAGLVACADTPVTAPAGAHATSSPALTVSLVNSSLVSQTQVGDTTVTVFIVGTNTQTGATFNIGNSSKIDFPYATGSICDPVTSGYGPGTWDAPCAAALLPVQITAKSWVTKTTGKLATDFQPALRFVPGLRKGVVLTLKDAALAGTHIDYCTASGCVNEALTDPTLVTQLDNANGFATRVIKHFSGYGVIFE